MNLFEKIFNYQVISRLDESGSFALTSQERSWLRMMLEHPSANDAFSTGTREKLQQLLEMEPLMDIQEIILEKASSQVRHVYHPLLRSLRRMMMHGQGILVTYRIKHGGVKSNQSGFPYKLEYSMVKREWYLLWYNTRHHTLMSTKLHNIVTVEHKEIPADRAEMLRVKLADLLGSRKECAVIEVIRTFNAELSRILYAFACFEKQVAYDEETDRYQIRLTFQKDESEFVLSKIRFLGTRVKIAEGEQLQRRMRESSEKALARYGVEG
ncbi:WYL domain-containing protein [Cohnella sp. WQ 127256]|uniref:WYL domain-containing protein n=1 Tax=Cohnella sp. WQ 127256 TaxID=2938790 RepID=UPI0021196DEB|nr:WYL domain-containing protein [Cohnella sp. WQ 127256]